MVESTVPVPELVEISAEVPESVPESVVEEVREELLGAVSENSKRGYDGDLRMFEAWWDAFGSGGTALGALLTLSSGELASERVAKWLDDSGTGPATQRRRLSTMNRFVRIANRRGIVPWRLSVAAPPGNPGVPLHTRAAHEAVEELLTDPVATQALLENFQAIKRGDCPQWFLDFVVQRPKGELDIYDAYCISSLHKQWVEEEFSIVRILVGKKPAPDRDRERNRQMLSVLPSPFKTSVEPDARGDGTLSWSESIRTTLETTSRMVPPGSVPIEIGSTESSRSWLHMLERDQGLARWPYGSEEIFLAVKVDSAVSAKLGKVFGS